MPATARWLIKLACSQAVAGAVVSLADGTIKAVDGPFVEAKELVGGYAILEVRGKAEAVELAKRLMQIHKDRWGRLGRQLRGVSADGVVTLSIV